MRTINLNTGVVVHFDSNDNQIRVTSPYVKELPYKMTILRYMVLQIKQIIKN